jgi:hypothetical protein
VEDILKRLPPTAPEADAAPGSGAEAGQKESPSPAARPTGAITGPAPKRKRRRPQYSFWPEVENHIFDLLEQHGPPSPDDPELPDQTTLENLVADFMQSKGWEAVESTIRVHVVGMLEYWGTLGR